MSWHAFVLQRSPLRESCACLHAHPCLHAHLCHSAEPLPLRRWAWCGRTRPSWPPTASAPSPASHSRPMSCCSPRVRFDQHWLLFLLPDCWCLSSTWLPPCLYAHELLLASGGFGGAPVTVAAACCLALWAAGQRLDLDFPVGRLDVSNNLTARFMAPHHVSSPLSAPVPPPRRQRRPGGCCLWLGARPSWLSAALSSTAAALGSQHPQPAVAAALPGQLTSAVSVVIGRQAGTAGSVPAGPGKPPLCRA